MPLTIVRTRVDSFDYLEAARYVAEQARLRERRYVCVANVHTVMEAHDSPDFASAVNNADLVAPDGMPLVWMMRWKGRRNQARVYGPTLMLHVLDLAAKEGIPVGFHGSSETVLNALKAKMSARFPGLHICYSFSPPYREVSPSEDAAFVEQINQSGARILFVGLGCPKQELWMWRHRATVNSVMIGVGAAFDFHAGAKPQAPAWMQKNGLEWLFRWMAEPRRLWKRYLYHNPRFVFLAAADLLKHFLGS